MSATTLSPAPAGAKGANGAQGGAGGEAEAKKPKLKKLLAVVVLLAVAGAAAWFFLLRGGSSSETPKAPEKGVVVPGTSVVARSTRRWISTAPRTMPSPAPNARCRLTAW